jgi:hypothetical protein
MLRTILRSPRWALHRLLRLGLGDRHFQFAREVNRVVAVGRFRYEITYYLYTKYQGLFWDELEFCGLHEITLAFNPGRWSDALFAAMQQSGIKNDELLWKPSPGIRIRWWLNMILRSHLDARYVIEFLDELADQVRELEAPTGGVLTEREQLEFDRLINRLAGHPWHEQQRGI